MSTYLYKNANYESPPRMQRIYNWLKREASFIPEEFTKRPIRTTAKVGAVALVAGTAMYMGVSVPADLHASYVTHMGNKAIDQKNPNPINLSVLWVQHSGAIAPGYAQLKEPEGTLGALHNHGLAALGKNKDAAVACDVINFNRDAASSFLHHIFRDAIKVEHFANADVQNSGKYACITYNAPLAKP